MAVYAKRFALGREVYRIIAEGNIYRVDEWSDGWMVLAEGRIDRGHIVDMTPITVRDETPEIPAGLRDAADEALQEISYYAERSDKAMPVRMRRREANSYGLAAKKLGITLSEYRNRKQAGQSWCSRGRHWTVDGVSKGTLVCPACRGVVTPAKRDAAWTGEERDAA